MEECRKRGLRHRTDEITYVSGGEGSTSEGEFWEALNTACNLKLPILFLIEDNKYAISVPVEAQTADGTIGALVKDWPGLRYEELDGCDPLECYRVLSDVVAGMRRRREGPARDEDRGRRVSVRRPASASGSRPGMYLKSQYLERSVRRHQRDRYSLTR